MQGFGTLVQVSRTEPLLLEPHMTKVNQMLCTLLRTTRSHVARYACQACKELFRTMQSTTRPEFDEIVQSLLQRTADTNKFIRHDANDALDTMVTYIPPNSSVRAIVEKGPFHKNSLIRTAVARLLLCIVTIIQVQFLFTLPAYKETRKRIFDASAVLINDANMATRNIIKRLFEMFIKDNNFDTLFQKETDKVLLKRIDKAIICLKYKPKK
ncbi:TOG array regulator of axonemal microtubules protein 2-like [Lycorma delicatula]|uniref:TOG array regulator of axonemal microtubules protein 2-like n=1 Tax=Lycorma delicatula TaxID=130591 RepID=UPI003F51284C